MTLATTRKPLMDVLCTRKVVMRSLAVLCAAFAVTGCTTYAANGRERRVSYVCDRGPGILVSYSGSVAQLETGSGSLVMTRRPSASGFWYESPTHSIRGKGDELVYTVGRMVPISCHAASLGSTPQGQVATDRAGTSWRLLRFQSSDDRIGIIIPPNTARYTLLFDRNGSLVMRLDCNRAMGRWSIPATSATGGPIAITGGAMTRAYCGPKSLDSQIARDLGRVRSYTIAGTQLSLSLEADGGTYLWERIGE